MSSLAQNERNLLCDAALDAGPQAPTLCGEWTVKELVIHLIVRERDPLGAPGILVPQLEGLTARSSRKLLDHDFAQLVERVRQGPHAWNPLRLGVVDTAINTLEYFVHHEDIRRAQPGWEARDLSDRDQRAIWKAISVQGKGLARNAATPLVIRWPGTEDRPERTAKLRFGLGPVILSGDPSEIALFMFGRHEVGELAWDGPFDKILHIKETNFGI